MKPRLATLKDVTPDWVLGAKAVRASDGCKVSKLLLCAHLQGVTSVCGQQQVPAAGEAS